MILCGMRRVCYVLYSVAVVYFTVANHKQQRADRAESRESETFLHAVFLFFMTYFTVHKNICCAHMAALPGIIINNISTI